MGGRPEHLPTLPSSANETGFALLRGDSDQWRRHRHPTNGTFDAAIVAQLAELVAARIEPGSVGFVTHIPSRRGGAVADLAERIANRLKLPHVALLEVADGPAQHTMANSATQLANATRRISLVASPPPAGGIIIDDTVDSRWTLTVAGARLRGAGATAVYPFVVADTSVG